MPYQPMQDPANPPQASYSASTTNFESANPLTIPQAPLPHTGSDARQEHDNEPAAQQQTQVPFSSRAPPQIPAYQSTGPFYPSTSMPGDSGHHNDSASSLPAARPVFGQSLDDLLQRDGVAVPYVVVQCIAAVSMFGLDIEGIYRVSGSTHHLTSLKQLFDHGNPPPRLLKLNALC